MTINPDSLQQLRIDRSSPGGRYEAPRRLPWILAAAAVLVLALGWWALGSRALEVSTAKVEASGGGAGGAAVLNASGYVVARRISTVSSRVTGQVLEVLIEEGATVEKDQLLARLDPKSTRAQVDLAERELAAAQRNLAEIDVRLAEARRNLARTETLREQALVSETALDAARAEVAALTARLAAQDAQRRVAGSGLALRRRDLSDLEIRAPFAGVVISKDAQPGEMVSPISAGGGFTRTGIATIVDMDSREIEVDVNEAFINRVSEGQRVEATLDAYPDAPLAARVINIVPTADRQKATVRVRIAFEKLEPRILPDMGIKVQFLDDAQPAPSTVAAARVPSAAVSRDGDNAYVWVVRDERIERRAVTLGNERDGFHEVKAGLRADEVVVTPLVEGLTEGAKVRIKQS